MTQIHIFSHEFIPPLLLEPFTFTREKCYIKITDEFINARDVHVQWHAELQV